MIELMPGVGSSMRIVFDEQRDEATIFLSDERQSAERGATYGIAVQEGQSGVQDPVSILVNVAFENYERLLWIKVNHASKVLPDALLAEAERT